MQFDAQATNQLKALGYQLEGGSNIAILRSVTLMTRFAGSVANQIAKVPALGEAVAAHLAATQDNDVTTSRDTHGKRVMNTTTKGEMA
jgi:hypothetical protein